LSALVNQLEAGNAVRCITGLACGQKTLKLSAPAGRFITLIPVMSSEQRERVRGNNRYPPLLISREFVSSFKLAVRCITGLTCGQKTL